MKGDHRRGCYGQIRFWKFAQFIRISSSARNFSGAKVWATDVSQRTNKMSDARNKKMLIGTTSR